LLVFSVTRVAYGEYPPLIDLAQDDPDALIIGGSDLARMATSMCAGDINGDGLLDLVVAACNATPMGGERQGEVAIIWGPALSDSGTIDLAVADGTVSRIFGQAGDDPIYCGVASGDFNNDGCDDIIVGAPSTPASTWQGKAYVVLGQTAFPDTVDLAAPPPFVFTVIGHEWVGWLGGGMCACDVNGDGYDEVILAAPGMEYSEVYLIHGGESFQATYYTGRWEPGMTRIVDPELDRGRGEKMACEDIDGDGCDDLLLGAPGIDVYNTSDGRATLLYGQPSLPDTIPLSDAAWRTTTILPEYQHGYLGVDVAIGDIDNDDQYDLIVGAYMADPFGCENCGEVYILHSAVDLPDTVPVDSTDLPITRLLGNGTEHFGFEILAADLTADFHDDMVIADRPYHGRAHVSVVYGRTLPCDTVYQETDTTLTRIIEESEDSNLGRAMVSGDFNGDQVNDLVLGAPYISPLGRDYAGVAYVFYGVASTTAVKPPVPAPVFVLKPNYPNPFSSETTIHFDIPQASDVTIAIYDVLGRRVRTIVRPRMTAGENTVVWDGRDETGRRTPSGVYFYRLVTPEFKATKKMVLLR
jgi:hypothetical protein